MFVFSFSVSTLPSLEQILMTLLILFWTIWPCVFLLSRHPYPFFSQLSFIIPVRLEIVLLYPSQRVGKAPNVSDNYCAIALAPTRSKSLEWCLLLQYPDQFSTSDLQFCLKWSMSTSLCTGAVKNVAHWYAHNGSAVFGCLLDAFDLVWHDILFGCQLQSHLPLLIISFLLHWYKSQCKMGRYCI